VADFQRASEGDEVIAQEVLQVPLGGGGERAFQTDEEGLLILFREFTQELDRAVLDVLIPGQTDQ
jgi:hypothetical protein